MKKKFMEDKMRKVQDAFAARQRKLQEEAERRKLERMIDSANSTNDTGSGDEEMDEPPELKGKLSREDLRELIRATLGDAATDNIIDQMLAQA